MSINADPKVINEAAGALINSFVAIYNETTVFDSELNKFGQTLDDDAYTNISSKLSLVIKRMEDSQEVVKTICAKLIHYAKEIEDSRKVTQEIL